jgi:NAD(P)-dependent dehydrogenase (short-subunit alcohol dehydrogenase family)
VITGASRGIGLETAKLLVADGASVLLVARGADRLAEATEACREFAMGSAQVAQLALDVTADGAAERIVDAAAGELGSVDILVNNAGTAVWRDLDDVPEADWYSAWELNVMAPMRLMKASLPAMTDRGWGRVVNVSSTAGKRPSQQIGEYSVAKAAQLSLSRLYADRYVKQGVLVNAVCPGVTASEMWMEPGGLLDQAQDMQGAGSREETRENIASSRPIGRLAESEEIAAAIAFLCSERASYVAGAAWSVDGGTVQVII